MVLRKRHHPKILTNLDILVAVDQMLGQGMNEVYAQVRDGILCISRTPEEFGRHVGKVYLGGVDEEIEFVDDLIWKEGFLGLTGANREVFDTTIAEYWGFDRREGEWRRGDVWLLLYVRRVCSSII